MSRLVDSRLFSFWSAVFIGCFSPLSGAQLGGNQVASSLPTEYAMYAILKTDLSSTHSRIGDSVELEVIDHVMFSQFESHSSVFVPPNRVYLPTRTRLKGTVTWVQRASKNQEAEIAIRLTQVHGQSLNTSIDSKLGYSAVLLKEGYTGGAAAPAGILPGSPNNPGSPETPEFETWTSFNGQIEPDETYGSALHSKRNFFLGKGATALEVIAFDQGQGNRSISGTVLDPSHNPVPGATVVLTIPGIGGWIVNSGADGTYVFNHLSAKSSYILRATARKASGSQIIDPMFLEAVSNLHIDVHLRLDQQSN